MQTFSVDQNNTSTYNFSITGPYDSYSYTYSVGFENEYVLMFNISISSMMQGDDELFEIEFDQSQFVSQNGASLYNSKLSTKLNKIELVEKSVETVSKTLDYTITISMIMIISLNVLLDESSELIWGFINTIQIMFFFPLLMLYFPDNLLTVFSYFSSSTLFIPIPYIEGSIAEFNHEIDLHNKLNMPVLNSRYEILEYESTSIIINCSETFFLIAQMLTVCMIVFAMRALYFTLTNRNLVKKYDFQLHQLQNAHKIDNSQHNQKPNYKKKKDTLYKKWVKKKVNKMSKEYKSTFLRMGIELYLEIAILSLLNIRYLKYENLYQIASLAIS